MMTSVLLSNMEQLQDWLLEYAPNDPDSSGDNPDKIDDFKWVKQYIILTVANAETMLSALKQDTSRLSNLMKEWYPDGLEHSQWQAMLYTADKVRVLNKGSI